MPAANPDIFRSRFDLLITAYHRGDEPALDDSAVARKLSVSLGEVVPGAMVSRWRNGQVEPAARYVQAIADAFAVPVTYFADTREGLDVAERLKVLIMIRDRYQLGGVNIIARGSTLTASQLHRVLASIDPDTDETAE